MAFIPGISMNAEGEKKAFIQIVDGTSNTSEFIEFNGSEFHSNKNEFALSIAENSFNGSGIEFNLPHLKGKIRFNDQVNWPKNIYAPNVMGPLNYYPFLECYHGVLSLNHTLKGKIEYNGKVMDFSGGKEYTEKDWGHSFPKAHVWMQSNHFPSDQVSFQAAIADVNILSRKKLGFIAGLWINGALYQFSTYNFSKLKKTELSSDVASLSFENRKYKLDIIAHSCGVNAKLIAPSNGKMEVFLNECLGATITLSLSEKKTGKIIFNETGRNGGLEIAGEFESLKISPVEAQIQSVY